MNHPQARPHEVIAMKSLARVSGLGFDISGLGGNRKAQVLEPEERYTLLCLNPAAPEICLPLAGPD